MIRAYREIENSYIGNFSKQEEHETYTVFWDEQLPDMYAFNCVVVKETMGEEERLNHACKLLEETQAEGRDFLKLLYNPQIPITESFECKLQQMGFETQKNLYMRIDPQVKLDFAANPDANVRTPQSELEFEAGAVLDVETSIALGMPEEFAIRKANHKKGVFQQKERLKSYLCWYNGQAVGECELHICNGYAKIEDLDVLESYQKRGLGTAILRQVISDVREMGIENIYLITGKDDTPRQMYSKLGFEIIGEELEIFWKR